MCRFVYYFFVHRAPLLNEPLEHVKLSMSSSSRDCRLEVTATLTMQPPTRGQHARLGSRAHRAVGHEETLLIQQPLHEIH